MGKGGESKVEIDKDLKRLSKQNYKLAKNIGSLGYQPNRGVTIAAFTPQQEAAMQGTQMAAGAFGMPTVDPMAAMPAPEVSASGIRGYSTGVDYDDMISRLPPEFVERINALVAGIGNRGGGGAGGGTFVPPTGGHNSYAGPDVYRTGGNR